jgi:hypothetical protein
MRKSPNHSSLQKDPTERRRVRQAAVARAAAEITRKNTEPTYEAIEEITGLPVGYLRWAFPTKESLKSLSAAS